MRDFKAAKGGFDRTAVARCERPAKPRVRHTAQRDDLLDGIRKARDMRLGYVRHMPRNLATAISLKGTAVKQNVTGLGTQQAKHDPQQGALARAVHAEQRHHLPRGDRQRDPVENQRRRAPIDDIATHERWLHQMPPWRRRRCTTISRFISFKNPLH
jgi:hypothetical protein